MGRGDYTLWGETAGSYRAGERGKVLQGRIERVRVRLIFGACGLGPQIAAALAPGPG